mgnify:CR=1 FL=1
MELLSGIVMRSTGGLNTVKIDETGAVVDCSVRGKIRLKGSRVTNPVVVGDRVRLTLDASGKHGTIEEIIPRKNYIIRRSTNLSKESHILAANIDQVFVMATISEPQTSLMFIDRLLITAEAYNIPAKIVFNKLDLCQGELEMQLAEYLYIYETAGYPCFVTSVTKKIGLEAIRNELQGKVSMFTGHSGVGKSLLLNTLEPSLNLKVGEISKTHQQGKHTTTFASMHELSFGGYVIDTPGIRAFGLIDIDRDELFHYFPEIFKLSAECKFYNCKHIQEPGCRVIQAVEEEEIPASRYQNYVTIFLDKDDTKYRTDDYQ